MMRRIFLALALVPSLNGFVSQIPSRLASPTAANLVAPEFLTETASSLSTLTSSFPSSLLSFTDQGQNLAGIFFQASLLPYLAFCYFLQYRANRMTPVASWGFQFVLFFVASTIPAGIVSKTVYETSLANVDYLHGHAELLLTVANVFIVRVALLYCL